MFSRFKETLSSKGDLLKRGLTASYHAIPGLIYVISKGGSAVFNSFKFSDYLARLFNYSEIGSKSPVGIILSTAALTTALVTTLYTRFFNMYHNENSKKKIPHSAATLNDNLLGNVSERKANCCYPGVDTDSWDLGYKSSQIINVIYGFGSGCSGILSMNSLVNLFQLWLQSNYDSKCDNNESDPYKIVMVNLATALLIYAILLSYCKYNIPALREYYRKLFIEQGWRDLTYWSLFESMMAAALSSVSVWFSFHEIANMVSDDMLCHMLGQANVEVPEIVTNLIAGVEASSTFINMALLTSGANINKLKKAREAKDINHPSEAKTTSEFGWMEKPLGIAIIGNAFNMGFATYVATADLPNTLAHRADLTTHPVTICIAAIGFLIAWRNSRRLDTESARRAEMKYRVARINQIEEKGFEAKDNNLTITVEEQKTILGSSQYDPTIFGGSNKDLSPNHPVISSAPPCRLS